MLALSRRERPSGVSADPAHADTQLQRDCQPAGDHCEEPAEIHNNDALGREGDSDVDARSDADAGPGSRRLSLYHEPAQTLIDAGRRRC